MKNVIKAPDDIIIPNGYKSIFLAGSIEMGKAEDWQTHITKELHKVIDNIIILNPRRDDFKVWENQEITNPYFYHQVKWEHDGLRQADYVLVYFDPKTQSPITLMEMGIIKDRSNVFVCCPKGFWRKGNVDFMVNEYKMHSLETVDDIVDELKHKMGIKLKGTK